MAKKRRRVVIPPGQSLETWPGPKHQTVFAKSLPSQAILEKEAQRLAVQLGPDHHKVRLLRKQLSDLRNGTVSKGMPKAPVPAKPAGRDRSDA